MLLGRLSVKAIILGFLASLFVGAILSFIIGEAVFHDNMSIIYDNTTDLVVWLILGTVFCVPGGFVAGRIAKDAPIFNAIVVGILIVLLNLALLSSMAKAPLWYIAIGFLLIIPASYLGGIFSVKRTSIK
jgi:hypothetical protein